MYFFDQFLACFFLTFNNFVSRDYIDGENHFTRHRKMSFKEYVIYVIVQRGNTNFTEALRYYRGFLKNDFLSITRQAIGKQRKYIKSKLYKDLSESFIDDLYHRFKGFSEIKGYLVTANDTSICDLPSAEQTRKEMKVKKHKKTGRFNSRARISCIMDVNSKFILSAKIVPKKIPEVKLAIEHLMELKERFDITKIFTTYDRGYASLELMVVTQCLGAKYLIRLKSTTFKHKIKNLTSDDGIIEVKIPDKILNKIPDRKIKQKAKQMKRIKIRIVKVKLKTGETEILATNVSKNEFSINELKIIYGKRWNIETGFDKLKNLIRIEDFSGRSQILIEQDFYASIFIYNVAMCIYHDSKKKIRCQPRERKHEYHYVPNFSKIISLLFEKFFDIITDILIMKEIIIEFIVNEVAVDPTNVKIDDDRIRGSLADPTNEHNGYKKYP